MDQPIMVDIRYLDLDGRAQRRVLEGEELRAALPDLQEFLLTAIGRGCYLDRPAEGVRDYIPAARILGIRVHAQPA